MWAVLLDLGWIVREDLWIRSFPVGEMYTVAAM
jgi:hypothetical protein